MEHPSPATVARLKAHGVQTYVIAMDGAIVFVSDGVNFFKTNHKA
jgi:beta-lactamase superfamily II metal-dependent hydrolase